MKRLGGIAAILILGASGITACGSDSPAESDTSTLVSLGAVTPTTEPSTTQGSTAPTTAPGGSDTSAPTTAPVTSPPTTERPMREGTPIDRDAFAKKFAAEFAKAGSTFVTPDNAACMGGAFYDVAGKDMAASIAAGQSFAKVADRVMTGGEKARFALAATAISLAVTAAFYIGLFAYYRVPFSMDNLAMMFTGDPGLAADLKNWLVIILAVATVLTWVVSWFFVGMGAKGAIKARDKLAAKQGRV